MRDDLDSLLASILIVLIVFVIIFVCSTTKVDDTIYSMDSTSVVIRDQQLEYRDYSADY